MIFPKESEDIARHFQGELAPQKKDVERITKRLDLLVATVTVVGAQWLIDNGHSLFGWSLLASNLVTGLYFIAKEARS